MDISKNKKLDIGLMGFTIIVIVSIFISILKLFQPNLDEIGHYTLSLLIITLGLWIFKPFNIPFSLSGLFFMASLLIIGLPANEVLSGFSNSSLWTLIPALFYGFALAKSGLGKRIAYFGMKSINATYPKLLIMWMIIGVVLSILTPSSTVRVVITIPIALQCVQICKIPKKSKGRSLVLITAWAMAIIPGGGWYTGSLAGPMISGIQSSVSGLVPIDFTSWLKVCLLPISLISIMTVIVGYFILRPSEKLNVSKEVFQNEYIKLGNISKYEGITALVLVISFIMFTTSKMHGLPDAAICLMGVFILGISGVITVDDIGVGISWDLVIFLGTAMGLGSVFNITGLSNWLSDILINIISPITGSPWIFVPVILICLFVWRLVDISGFPTMVVITAVSPEIFARYNINPLVWVPLMIIAMNSFLLSYQNMFILMSEASMKDEGWDRKHLIKYGFVYFVVSIVSIILIIPYWISIGMF